MRVKCVRCNNILVNENALNILSLGSIVVSDIAYSDSLQKESKFNLYSVIQGGLSFEMF